MSKISFSVLQSVPLVSSVPARSMEKPVPNLKNFGPEPKTVEDRLIVLELQVGRIISDAESEKDTRARSHKDIYLALGEVKEGMREAVVGIKEMGGKFEALKDKNHRLQLALAVTVALLVGVGVLRFASIFNLIQ